MRRWNLTKKLSPAKKAWKSFTTKVQPKLQKLLQHTLPNAVKAATRRLLISFGSFLPSKLRTISNPSRQSQYYHHNNSNCFYTQKNCYHNTKSQPFYNKSFAVIHIDELFDQRPAVTASNTSANIKNNDITNPLRKNTQGLESPGTSHIHENKKGKRVVEYHDRDQDARDITWGRSKSDLYSVEEAWKAVVASSPQLQCVDERAEEFISKVRRDMQLQKEKSILELEEMLARGA